MLAGTASADITPEPGQILQGHYSTNPSHTVLYPLEVRSIAFVSGESRLAVATLDLVGVTLEMTQRMRQRVYERSGIEPDNVMIACSHTHCGPPILGVLGMGADPHYLQEVEQAVVDTIDQAASNAEPVTLGLGAGSAYFNVNRRPLSGSDNMAANEAEVVDRRARVLRIDRADGSPMAVLFHYSCHPTTKSGSEGYISPDYPGLARTHIESHLNCHALFLPGCFGNIRPAILEENGQFGSATKEQLEDFGRQLGSSVCHTVDALRTTEDDRLSAGTADLEVPYGPTDPIDELKRIASGDSPIRAPWAEGVLQAIERGEIPSKHKSQMQAMRIGPIAMISIPGEPVQEIGYAVEKTLMAQTDAHDIWPLGYTNDSIGYLCTNRHYTEGGYEPTAYPNYGAPAPFTREQETIVNVAQSLGAHV